MIQVDDFYRILVEKGIRMHYENHDNLTDFLMLSKQYPMFILVANIKRALETIHQNEKFMKAIEDDIRAEEQGRRERESGEFTSSKGSSLIKNATENKVKNRSRENMKIHPKVATLSQTRGQHSSIINAKTGIETNQEHHGRSFF